MRPKIYSLKEAAEALKYASADVLRNEISDNRIKAEKIGNQWFIAHDEMERLFKYRSSKHILGHLFYCETLKTQNENDCSCLKGKMEATDNGGWSSESSQKWRKALENEIQEENDKNN